MADQPAHDIYLQPGELQLVAEPAVIRTVLGSCVGIAFRHSGLGVGGMCHPMLPTAPKPGEQSTRFVDVAIHEMARQLDALGALRTDVEVKLFGGADVLPVHHGSRRATVGRLNCEAALRILGEEGYRVVASSLGGVCGVHIQFHTGTGEVLLRRLG
jgi:chemotaxis protein CheD